MKSMNMSPIKYFCCKWRWIDYHANVSFLLLFSPKLFCTILMKLYWRKKWFSSQSPRG